MKRTTHIFSILISLFLSCTSSGQYAYQPPEYINDGLEVGTPDEVDIDFSILSKGIDRTKNGKFGEIHSLLIYKDNKLVLEEYFPGHQYKWDGPRHYGELTNWSMEKQHAVHSVTKSITSACIGIAIDKGFIASSDQSIFDFLPDHQHFKSDGREKMTIGHLLTMTSGLSWYEWGAPYSSPENPVIGIWFTDKDPVSFILDAPVIHEPGTHFAYYGGSQVLLGEVLRHATGMDIDRFSKEYLFKPMEIDTADWAVRHDNGVIEAAGGLKLTPRSMVKIGAMFLNDGKWKEKRIISKDWVRKSAVNYNNQSINVPGTDGKNLGYGYSWWIPQFTAEGKEISALEAGGWGGQKIVVIPDLNTVVVFTGGNYTSRVRQFRVLRKYIVPALSR